MITSQNTKPIEEDDSKLIENAISLINENNNSNNESVNLNDAATLIQSTYKGYKTRKEFITNKNAIIKSKLAASTISPNLSNSSNLSNDCTNDLNEDANVIATLTKSQKKTNKKKLKKKQQKLQGEKHDENN